MTALPDDDVVAGDPARIMLLGLKHPSAPARLDHLLDVGVTSLREMYVPEAGLFAHSRRRTVNGSSQLVGVSERYTAIVALGASRLPENEQRSVLGGLTAQDLCSRLVDTPSFEIGAAALTAWAAAELEHPHLSAALANLRRLEQSTAEILTVPASWAVTAYAAASRHVDVEEDISAAHARLLAARAPSGLFAHRPHPDLDPWWRRNVSCFADQVYPIQAMARFAAATGDRDSLAVAERCAQQICRLQGPAGQWWWHYDWAAGTVSEGYPVYSVHQISMAPMALLDLVDAGGPLYIDAIARGIDWMLAPPELIEPLVVDEPPVIWRKVARSDPAKLVRRASAVAAGAAARPIAAPLGRLFRPDVIDRESRPYEWGWALYVWRR